nr:hypothetical protein [Tanacetum cinerariifolium]
LHLNLPFLEVLDHVLIYNAILDKYVKSLELGKNGSAFVQGEIPAKMEDPGPLTLPCRLGGSKPFDTLADLGSCVTLRLLEETYHIFGLAGRGFLDIANIVILAKIVVGEGINRSLFGKKGVDLGEEEAPYWATLGKRESYKPRPHSEGVESLIQNPINWDKPPKNGDEAWHAKIRLIDPDGEEFTKTLQSIPTTRKLFEEESSREIIDLDHFYDT